MPHRLKIWELYALVTGAMPLMRRMLSLRRAGYAVQLQTILHFPTLTGWKIFQTYIYPVLSYGSVAWNPDSRGDIKIIERVQRQFTKKLTGLSSLSYEQRFKRLGALSAESTRFVSDMTFAFKIIHDLMPFTPSDFGLTLSGNNTRGPRFKHDRLYRSAARHFFRYRIPMAWNKLPENIRGAPRLSTFSNLLCKWLQTDTNIHS